MSEFFDVLLLATLGGVIALAGGVIFLFSKSLSKILSKYSVPFAAGVLLTVALLGLLPEAVHMVGEDTFVVVLVAFLVSYLFEHLFFDIHHHEGHDHSHKSSIPLIIVGDTIHNFIDGVAIAAAYFVNPGLGLVTAISTLLHEVPHEIGDFGILLNEGWSKKKVLFVNVISAAFTIVGALFVLIATPSELVMGYLLAIAAGMFLYLGASDFLPHIHEGQKNPKRSVIALILGVLIMGSVFYFVPHDHEDFGHTEHSEEEMEGVEHGEIEEMHLDGEDRMEDHEI